MSFYIHAGYLDIIIELKYEDLNWSQVTCELSINVPSARAEKINLHFRRIFYYQNKFDLMLKTLKDDISEVKT